MRITKLKVWSISAALFLIFSLPVKQAHAYSPAYFLCQTKPITTSIAKWFFSDVFSADSTQRYKIQQKFTRYIADNYPDDNTGPADCLLYNNRETAEKSHSVKSSQHGVDGAVIDTGWTYAAASTPPAPAAAKLGPLVYGWCVYAGKSTLYFTPVYSRHSTQEGGGFWDLSFEKWVEKNYPDQIDSRSAMKTFCQGGTSEEATSTREHSLEIHKKQNPQYAIVELSAPPSDPSTSKSPSPAGHAYFLCQTKPITTSIARWFFSGVFEATAAQQMRVEQAFTRYVAANYSSDNTGPADCLIYNNPDTAERDHSVKSSQHGQDGAVIDTGWVYPH
jgi:hypothetical protein